MPLIKLNATQGLTGALPAVSGASLTGVSAGKVLQVVSASDGTQRASTSTSFVTASNTLSVSITPSATSSKIYIVGHTTIHNTTANKSTYLTVFRDGSQISGVATLGFANYYTTSGYDYNSNAFTFLDSPNSTSSLTYQVYFKNDSGSTGAINSNVTTGTITVMEIAG